MGGAAVGAWVSASVAGASVSASVDASVVAASVVTAADVSGAVVCSCVVSVDAVVSTALVGAAVVLASSSFAHALSDIIAANVPHRRVCLHLPFLMLFPPYNASVLIFVLYYFPRTMRRIS